MALAAYYAKQKKKEHVEEAMGEKAAGDLDFISKVKGVAKKVGRVLGGPDDEGHRKDLQKKMGVTPQQQHGKKSMAKYNEETEQTDEAFNANAALERAKSDDKKKAQGYEKVAPFTFRKKQTEQKPVQKEEVEQVEEGWDDMLKAVKERNGPKPSGGSGVKQGTRYGGSRQKETPEQEEEPKKKVNEAKRPEDDSVPFEPPYNTSSRPAEVTDKSGATHTPMSRAKHLARLAMSRVKKDLGTKGK